MQTDGELIRQARGFFESGDFSNAEQAYQQLFEQMPEAQQPDVLTVISVCQRAQDRLEEGIATLRQAVELDDLRANSWFQLGLALRESGDEDRAAEALDRAVVLDPNHALARYERGRQAMDRGDVAAATEAFEIALKADPDCVPALAALADRRIADGKPEAARELASKAVQNNPNNSEAQIAMARVFRADGQIDFAEQCLTNALSRTPESAPLHQALAQLLIERGRFEVALHEVAEARRCGSSDPRLMALESDALRELGQLHEARLRLEAMANADALDDRRRLSLAELRLADGDTAGAGEMAEALEASWPSGSKLIAAQVAEASGDMSKAAELAAGLHDDASRRIQQQARLISARLALARNDTDGCIAAVEPLAAGEKTSPFVHWILARAYDRAGRYDEASKHIESTGWRTPPLLRARREAMPDRLYDAIDQLSVADWPKQPPDDGRSSPIFLLGWPGSGREVLHAALADQPGLTLLKEENAERRRDALGLPASPLPLARLDDNQVRVARKRYLRELDAGDGPVLEPMWLPLGALPALARYFPGSTVVLADADLEDLKLHWRLHGFRGIDAMHKLWEREQGVLDRLFDDLPLDVIVVSRSDLEREPGQTAAELSESLGLADADSLSQSLSRRLQGLRPVGHWHHYAHLFEDRQGA